MTEYIEREKVLGIINELQSVCATEVPEDKADIYNDVFDEVYGEMRTIPAADVRPERHGEWKINSDGYYPYCSECGFEPKEMSPFCPQCGTKMTKGTGDEIC